MEDNFDGLNEFRSGLQLLIPVSLSKWQSHNF